MRRCHDHSGLGALFLLCLGLGALVWVFVRLATPAVIWLLALTFRLLAMALAAVLAGVTWTISALNAWLARRRQAPVWPDG